MPKPRVLVVDDEWSMRELLKTVLEVYGFEPLLAKDAEEFEQLALNAHPDTIILDIILGPETDGTQVYEKLLSKGLSRDIPVIFISGLARERPNTIPQLNHRYALVGKPFNAEHLAEQIHILLSENTP